MTAFPNCLFSFLACAQSRFRNFQPQSHHHSSSSTDQPLEAAQQQFTVAATAHYTQPPAHRIHRTSHQHTATSTAANTAPATSTAANTAPATSTQPPAHSHQHTATSYQHTAHCSTRTFCRSRYSGITCSSSNWRAASVSGCS